MNTNRRSKATRELARENLELRARLAESEETLRAIRCGEVDAFFVHGAEGDRVLALEGAESAYRALVEAMMWCGSMDSGSQRRRAQIARQLTVALTPRWGKDFHRGKGGM